MTAMEAYRQAGYTGDAHKNSWLIKANQGVSEAIEKKLDAFIIEAEHLRKQTLLEARQKQISLMRSAENEFVQLNATKEILGDSQKIDLGGQSKNPVKIELEYFDTPEEDDLEDGTETISE